MEPLNVRSFMNDMDLGVVAAQRRTRTPLRLRRIRFPHAFGQYPGHKPRVGNHCIGLAEQKSFARPTAGALGQMPSQNHPGMDSREARRKDGPPKIAPMMPMHDLDPFASDESRRLKNEAQFEWAFPRDGMQGDPHLPATVRPDAIWRPAHPHPLAQAQ